MLESLKLKLWDKVAKLNWRDFEEAREFARKLGLNNANDWREIVRSRKLPKDIPAAPHWVYIDHGWVSWGDWLGTEIVSTGSRTFLSFKKARAIVRRKGLENASEWRAFTKTEQFLKDIPVNPDQVYGDQGWDGYGDWLGTGAVAAGAKTYLSFKRARAIVRRKGLKNVTEWRAFTKTEEFLEDIPVGPERVYQDQGWDGYGDWLGTGFVYQGTRTYRTFEKARAFVRSHRLKSIKEWRAFTTTKEFSENIPVAADVIYRNQGWISWSDWLGTKPVPTYLPFNKARSIVRRKGLKNVTEWRAFTKTEEFLEDIPATPDRVYRDQGWIGYVDWLGN